MRIHISTPQMMSHLYTCMHMYAEWLETTCLHADMQAGGVCACMRGRCGIHRHVSRHMHGPVRKLLQRLVAGSVGAICIGHRGPLLRDEDRRLDRARRRKLLCQVRGKVLAVGELVAALADPCPDAGRQAGLPPDRSAVRCNLWFSPHTAALHCKVPLCTWPYHAILCCIADVLCTVETWFPLCLCSAFVSSTICAALIQFVVKFSLAKSRLLTKCFIDETSFTSNLTTAAQTG